MPSLPHKDIINIFNRAHENEGKTVYGGRSYSAKFAGNYFTLYHYGTEIITVDEWNNRYTVSDEGFSQSDAAAINSVLMMYGINAHVRSSKRSLYTHHDDEGWEVHTTRTYGMKSKSMKQSEKWGIFNERTGELDCDPEPMVFPTRSGADAVLYNSDIYDDPSDWYVAEVFE